MLTERQQKAIEQISKDVHSSSYVLCVINRCGYTGPVLEVAEKQGQTKSIMGRMYGSKIRVCRFVIQILLDSVLDDLGMSYNSGSLIDGKIEFRGNIPLNEEVGTKLALIFQLCGQMRDSERIELLAWRVSKLAKEEAEYFYSRVSIPFYGKESMEWAKSGLRIMFAGDPKDKKSITKILDAIRR